MREIHVEPDPTRMAALGVGLTDVFTALQKASANATGGYVERGAEMFVIRSLGIFKDIGRHRGRARRLPRRRARLACATSPP